MDISSAFPENSTSILTFEVPSIDTTPCVSTEATAFAYNGLCTVDAGTQISMILTSVADDLYYE